MVSITSSAVSKLKEMMQSHNIADYGLRVSVRGSGCSGFKYFMDFVKEGEETDKSIEVEGLQLFMDPDSYANLNDVTVDFIDSDAGTGFKFEKATTEDANKTFQV